MDPFSPVAPAHVGVLVLPVGHVERRRFLLVLHRLQTEASHIPLARVPQNTDSDALFLSPKVFPEGSLLYRYSSATISDQHQLLSPYELFREPLLVLGIVDGSRDDGESGREELEHAVTYLKELHPRVVRRQLLVLSDIEDDNSSWDHVKAVRIANAETSDDPALRTAMCDVSERFLVDLTTFAKALHASPTIVTPGQTARSLQRTASLKEGEKRPESGRSTPPYAAGVSSPADQGSPARSPPKAPPIPATTFDQIAAVTNPPSNVSRPESRASNKSKNVKRSSSQDRVAVQGFGSSTSQEKIRMRGKARVGIVLGSIQMIAGQWGKALPVLVEHTSKSRSLQDHLWHAKGLENILVCMLLLAWCSVEFQVPNICEPVIDRSGPSHAARIAAETKAAAEGTRLQLQLFRLSITVPDLSRLILSLYRSNEGSLELPFMVIGEANIRMSRLLALLATTGGHFTSSTLRLVVCAHNSSKGTELVAEEMPTKSLALSKAKLSKTAIADLLAQALPTSEDGVVVGDHMRLLAGIASVYAMLHLHRKKAITIKDLVVRLTGALIQARKLGAAEVGIHPAASLSIDTGADAVRSIIEESKGLEDLMTDVSGTYGTVLAKALPSDRPSYFDTRIFGNRSLQYDLLRELAAFCEASPDPHGVLLLTTSLLRAAGPNAAIDVAPGPVYVRNAFTREDQMHLATVIHRTVAISKHLGLADVLATYWDPFLVRGIEILQPSGRHSVIDRSKIEKLDTNVEHTTPGNPLLYDPNASRPGTAEKQIFLLVENEASECVVTFQNPFDIPVDIEQLELVTDGVALASHHVPVTLGPLRVQKVSLTVTPESAGSTKINGCRIKMQGCRSQVFPLVEQAWSAKSSLTVKELGLNACPPNRDSDDQYQLKSIGLDSDNVTASIISALPSLLLESSAMLDSGVMLLEGESRPFTLTLRNTGTIAACIFDLKDTGDVLRRVSTQGADDIEPNTELSAVIVKPTESVTFNLEVEGKAGVSYTQAAFYYSTINPSATKYARVVLVPLEITVNAALQVQNFEVASSGCASDGGALLVSFDVRNAWPRSISYECVANGAREIDGLSGRDGSLSPGEIRRVNMLMPLACGQYVQDMEVVKEEFLRRLRVSWKTEDRSGMADLQSLSLSVDSLSLLRGAPIQVEVAAAADNVDKGREFTVGSFISVRIRLFNRSKRSSPLSVDLSTDSLTGGAAAETSVAVVGTLQHLVSPLEEEGERVLVVVLCPLLAGPLHLEVVVRPVAITHNTESNSEWVEKTLLSLLIK